MIDKRVRGGLLIETMISMVIISIIMLMFSFVVINAFKADVKLRNRIKAAMWLDQVADSLRIVPVLQINDFRLTKAGDFYIKLEKQAQENGLMSLDMRCYHQNKEIEQLKLLRFE